jgi:hypothetical protein
MATIINSSSGGTIKVTSTGLEHRAAAKAYSGALAEQGLEAKVYDAPKRGRGRPAKVSQSGAVYETSALTLALFGKVKVPKFRGVSTVYNKSSV